MREESKLRSYDERASDLVSQFLDKNFYSSCSDVERIYTKKEQVKGVDIKFTFNGKRYICDEKAAIRYVNQNLKTFALELSFIDRNGDEHDGWLIDEEKINNSFMFIWLDKADKDTIHSIDDIKELELMIVSRDKIIEYLNGLGWTINKLKKKCIRLRTKSNEIFGSIDRDGLKFAYSDRLVEKPINVLLNREIYRKICDFDLVIN